VLGSGTLIFVTVGSMMPFDRLIQVMDKWAEHHPEQDTFAQIGRGSYLPAHTRWTRTLSPREFRAAVSASAVVVAHAGMGSFFICMEMLKPLVMLPRDASRNEVTTDHQISTSRWLRNKPGIYVAMSDDEVPGALDKALANAGVEIGDFSRFAPEPFTKRIRQFLVE
jgi:UDP-N-acetylglucosamine transferase subunit ALG13